MTLCGKEVTPTAQTAAPVFSVAWRQDRTRAVRYLCCAHLSWAPREQRRHVRRLFPQVPVDWHSIDAAHLAGGSDPSCRPATNPVLLSGLPVVIQRLRQWADLTQVPTHQAAIALAAAHVLTDWMRGESGPVCFGSRP